MNACTHACTHTDSHTHTCAYMHTHTHPNTHTPVAYQGNETEEKFLKGESVLNSGFKLHRPMAFDSCFRKQHGGVHCLRVQQHLDSLQARIHRPGLICRC